MRRQTVIRRRGGLILGTELRGNADGLFDIDFDFERALPGQTELDKLRLILERFADGAEKRCHQWCEIVGLHRAV